MCFGIAFRCYVWRESLSLSLFLYSGDDVDDTVLWTSLFTSLFGYGSDFMRWDGKRSIF